MRPARLLPFAFSCALLLAAAPAFAQTTQPGFNLDRFEPSERGSDWFALESLDLRGHGRPAIGVVGDYSYRPLVLYDLNDNERAAIVRHSLLAHVGISLVLWDRLRLAASYPFAITQKGEDAASGSTLYRAPSGAAAGDLRLGADLRLIGTYTGVFTAALGAQVWVPTGDRDNYMSDGKARVQPHLLAAGDIGAFAYAAKIGVNIRPQTDQVGGSPMGSEAMFGASAGVRAAQRRILIGPEIYGSTVVSNSDAFLKKATTPFEVLVGAHFVPAPDLRFNVGVGPGLTRGFGSPELRVVASIEFFPAIKEKAPPPPDRDQDGIIDAEDACPDVAGIRTDDPKTNGCPPPPPDRDKDGIIDAEDACPDVAGIRTDDPKTNGCPPPPPDRDKDGIIDAEDACPDTPGVATQDPKTNGCPPPPPDRDKDGIIDSEDACPDVPGPRDPDPKKNGCPAARVEQGQIVITQQVKFETGKANILPASDAILGSVATVLKDHPEIKLVNVQGHTDNKGTPAFNKGLSQQRAASVVAWLVKNGTDKKRLVPAGFGQDKPIDTNETEEGRQNNRRVEFHIVEPGTGEAGKPAPSGRPTVTPPLPGKPKTAPPPPPAGKGKTAPPPMKGKK